MLAPVKGADQLRPLSEALQREGQRKRREYDVSEDKNCVVLLDYEKLRHEVDQRC